MKHAKDKARFGVKAKLMSFILPVVAIAFLILSMVAFFVSRASIREKTESLMDAEGTASVNQIAGWQSDNLTTLDTALDSMVYLKMDDEEILNYEAQFLGTMRISRTVCICLTMMARCWTLPAGNRKEKRRRRPGIRKALAMISSHSAILMWMR